MGILGPNGDGKTTLLRMLGRILTPDSGNINICGYDYSVNKNKAKKEIGYLSGNKKFYNRFSPRELLTTFASLYEMSKDEIEKSINEVIDIMDMEKFIDNRIEHLSTGQPQRTSIARYLVHSPKVYIFDEPTFGLDVISSKSIIDFMKNEKKKEKIVLYSTHYMDEAETLCDKIIMIHQGRSKIIKQIFKKEVLDTLRDKKTIFMMIILPIILYPILVLGITYFMSMSMNSMEKEDINIAFNKNPNKILYSIIEKEDKTRKKDDSKIGQIKITNNYKKDIKDEKINDNNKKLNFSIYLDSSSIAKEEIEKVY